MCQGRGGLHLYFTAPGEKQLRGSAGRLGWKVDTRTWGGYVVAAGSTVHRRPYEIIHDAPPSPLPTWLSDLLTPPPAPPPVSVTTLRARIKRADRYGAAALSGEVAQVLAAPHGSQNTTLYGAAYALGKHVKAGTLPGPEVPAALTDAGLSIGLAPARCAATIRDGIRRGSGNTRGETA
ncbi:bifunctional DNA primase/polymerase [Actinacidiphila oryziradicis]|uniref:bifunctional DNA primase/polymerase n=1 Tax=Actinacidiphila oryziradicis TaxID=2571141 RepID=UPI0023F10924|nr:bifunctional DNA primase/polymerase [Actinacidiphila oryziradicis]MCW2873422.1 primase [Actinacidiphila oryziradicis]